MEYIYIACIVRKKNRDYYGFIQIQLKFAFAEPYNSEIKNFDSNG